MTFDTPIIKCKDCGSLMVARTRKDGRGAFIGCSNYPACRAILPTQVNDRNVGTWITQLEWYLWVSQSADPEAHGLALTRLSAALAPYVSGRLVKKGERKNATPILDIKEDS